MKVYIAGPMRGHPDWNFPAFDAAVERWKAAGYTAFSPAALDRAFGYSPAENTEEDKAHLRHVMLTDAVAIVMADAIALLPGWEKSYGATFELSLALFLSMPVYDAITMERIAPMALPWAFVRHNL